MDETGVGHSCATEYQAIQTVEFLKVCQAGTCYFRAFKIKYPQHVKLLNVDQPCIRDPQSTDSQPFHLVYPLKPCQVLITKPVIKERNFPDLAIGSSRIRADLAESLKLLPSLGSHRGTSLLLYSDQVADTTANLQIGIILGLPQGRQSRCADGF